ncbi:MAG: hypothetical protein WKF61_02625 [Luteimonas sp.]
MSRKLRWLALLAACVIALGIWNAGTPWPSLYVDASKIPNHQLGKIVTHSWMNTREGLEGEISKEMGAYFRQKQCHSGQCAISFGFDSCSEKDHEILCKFSGKIQIRHQENSQVKNKNETLHILIQTRIQKKETPVVTVERSGTVFVL